MFGVFIMLFLVACGAHAFAFRATSRQRLARAARPSLRMMSEKREQIDVKANIARLKAMAAQLKAEASELEAEVQQERFATVVEAFQAFDTNKDGSISVEELREGLSKTSQVTDELAKKLMEAFDESGDGAIQIGEFKGVEALKMKLDSILRDEREAALRAKMDAKEALAVAELEDQRATALAQFLNDGPPSVSDRIVSTLPYLFPLLDMVQYGSYLINTELDNPLVATLTVLYGIYQTVPFSGLIAFFALSALSNNMRLNRLVRFNIQQAIFLDIALIIPGILGGVSGVLIPYLGLEVPPFVSIYASTFTFFLFSAAIIYSLVSSVSGITPDKIPFVSERVEIRVPTADMFDEQGQLIPREERLRIKEKKEKDNRE